MPAAKSDDVWQSFLRWLAELRRTPNFTRAGSLDRMTEHLNKLKADTITARIDIPTLSNRLSALIAELTTHEEDYENPRPGQEPADLLLHITTLRTDITTTESALEDLEAAAAADEAIAADPTKTDPFAEGQPYIPIAEPNSDSDRLEAAPARTPWPEENYDKFAERIKPLYPPVLPGKLAMHMLDPPMADPKELKFLIPRPLEIYTVEEINSVAP
jgi:hypothetical protein